MFRRNNNQKKDKMLKKLVVLAIVVVSLSSCYNTRVCVGNVQKDDPVVKVQSVMNHHLLGGLIPIGNTKLEASKYVKGKKNYVIKNNWNLVDGFLNIITFGIYTPTHTTFYLPIDELK